MTRAQDDLQARARRRHQALRRKQRDPRFRNAMGRFIPAVLVKKPGLLRLPKELPNDVAEVVHAIGHGKTAPCFRGVPPKQYLPWVTVIRMALELLEASTPPE